MMMTAGRLEIHHLPAVISHCPWGYLFVGHRIGGSFKKKREKKKSPCMSPTTPKEFRYFFSIRREWK
jgi:hypothetical protein